MLTRRALEKLLEDILHDLFKTGLDPQKVILFGSYSKGGVHTYSDIDLAIWSHNFVGEGLIDLELIRPLLRKYKNLDIKMYPAGANAENFDPFIKVIEDTGRELNLPEKSIFC
jgi:predicted nucleotidyltransferase